MKILFATLIATTALATSAFAADNSSFYAGITGDISAPQDNNVTGGNAVAGDKVKYGFSSGGNVELGYRPQALNNATGDVRLEAEAGYHAFGLDSVTAGGVLNSNPKSDLKVATFMANAYYDLHTGTQLTPYVGAGLGDALVNFDKKNAFGATTNSDNELAYQLMAGVSYTPTSMPKTDWTVGYRYLSVASPKFAATGSNVKLDTLKSSSAEIGFRYHF